MNASLDGDSARAQPVPVVVYRDGLQLHTWPFRPVTDASAQGILVDILDGYFPFILQGDFPEGVPLVLLDMSHLEYLKGVPPLPSARRANANPPSNNNIVSWSEVQAGGRDAGAAVTKEKYLKQLPQTVIKDGRVIEVRNEIRALLEKKGGGAHVGGLTPSQAAAEAANQRQVGEPAGMPASKPSLLDRRQSLSEVRRRCSFCGSCAKHTYELTNIIPIYTHTIVVYTETHKLWRSPRAPHRRTLYVRPPPHLLFR